MKTVSIVIVIQVCSLFLPALAVRMAPKGVAPKPSVAAMPKKETKGSAQGPVMVVEEPVVMEVVPVPVIEVVVVEGGPGPDGEFEYASGDQEAAPENHGLEAACQKELASLQSNNTLLQKAQQCEDEGKTMESVVTALQSANLDSALALTEKTFTKCSSLTTHCAKQVAPQTIQKLRLSGMAVTEKCAAAVQKGKKPDTGGICMKNMTGTIVKALQGHDLELAMVSAQHGLGACMQIAQPCDFQFAPMVAMQIAQLLAQQAMQQEAETQPQVVEVLMNGLREMRQVSSNMTTAQQKKQKDCEDAAVAEAERASKEVQDIMKDVRGRMDKIEDHFQKVEDRTALRKKTLQESQKANARPVIVMQKKKALSLLSLSDGLRVGFRGHTLAL